MEKRLPQPKALPVLPDGITKAGISSLAKRSIDNVLEQGNAAQVAEAVAVMEEFIKQIRKDDRFIDFMRDELIKNNGNITTASGAKLELCEAGVTYDYSEDVSWRSLDEEIKNLTARRKALEEKLRKLRPGKMMVDEETGEVMIGPLKSSRSTYRITLSK